MLRARHCVPVFILLLSLSASRAGYVCAVYFTGIGCPHCAKTDPVVLGSLPLEYQNLVIIEYEIYQQPENAPLIYAYDSYYGSGLGIPLLIFGEGNYIRGDTPILENVEGVIQGMSENPCPLLSGSVSFEELNLSSLPGKPKIWANGRVLIPINESRESLNEALFSQDVLSSLPRYEVVEPEPVPLSGRYLYFNNAVEVGGWLLEWKEETSEEGTSQQGTERGNQTLTLAKIASLAAVDAVNPCALAVLTLILVSILTYDPKKKKNVLLAGLAFTSSVYVIYLLYGLVIIRFFQLIQFLTSVRLFLYKVLGMAAILLGILQIKDFIWYKPGGLLTEMPMSWRPRVRKLLSGVTSPKGAFLVGAFVTIFLLPCTIGPYVIAGGILSFLKLMETLPWLLFYNLIFVSPMIGMTLLVYGGIAKVEDISGWRRKNIQRLHLVAGLIILFLGIGMLFGLI